MTGASKCAVKWCSFRESANTYDNMCFPVDHIPDLPGIWLNKMMCSEPQINHCAIKKRGRELTSLPLSMRKLGYSGWIVQLWTPCSCKTFFTSLAMGMKLWSRDRRMWTLAMSLDSESCQMWSSCNAWTPSIPRIALRTDSGETLSGTACRRMKDALRTFDYLNTRMILGGGTHQAVKHLRIW